MKRAIKKVIDGFLAGILISIGGSVYLSVENKVYGAILFSVALLCICYKGYSLFTGKVGYLPENHSKEAISVLLLGLFGNAIATVLFGYLLAYAVPSMQVTATALVGNKFAQEWGQTLIRAVMCGILMYLAVSIFRDHKTPIGILFCIPVFILSGFEHSIADMFYFAVWGDVSGEGFLFLMTVILGNAIGGVLLPLLTIAGKKLDA